MLKDMKTRKHLKLGQMGTKRLVADDDLVKLIVTFTEKGLRDRLKAAGGRWDPQEKLWPLRYGAVRGTELKELIMVN